MGEVYLSVASYHNERQGSVCIVSEGGGRGIGRPYSLGTADSGPRVRELNALSYSIHLRIRIKYIIRKINTYYTC